MPDQATLDRIARTTVEVITGRDGRKQGLWMTEVLGMLAQAQTTNDEEWQVLLVAVIQAMKTPPETPELRLLTTAYADCWSQIREGISRDAQ